MQPRLLGSSLPFHIAANFQRVVAKEMRMLEQSNTRPQDDTEPSLEHLMDLQCRNEAKDNGSCVNMYHKTFCEAQAM